VSASASASRASGGGGSGDEAPAPPPPPSISIEETLALLAAEVQELRREVRELREARASGGLATVGSTAEGRRFLTVDEPDEEQQTPSSSSSQRPRPLPNIGDDDAARMAARVAAGRTGGLAVIESSGFGSVEEEEDSEEEGRAFAAAAGSGSDSDDDLAADALFEEDERLVLRRQRRRRGPEAQQQGQNRGAPGRVVSPSAAELAARWRDAERERERLRQQSRSSEASSLPQEEEDRLNNGNAEPAFTRPVLGPATNVSHGGGGARMTLDEFRALPEAIFLVRHAESLGNTRMSEYATTPDYDVQLSPNGWQQAVNAGVGLRDTLERRHGAGNYRIFFALSPYCRTRQTFVAMRQAFDERSFAGLEEDINLREQEFSGGLQTDRIRRDLEERLRYGRFFFRFPQGESTADVYVRQCLFEDQLLRSLRSGRLSEASHVVIIGHGISLRVLLMRLLGWTVESFLQVHNPPNATPLEIEKISEASFLRLSSKLDRRSSLQIRQCYRLSAGARRALRMDTDLSSSTMDLLHQQFT
jgi:broad specificity phosphatase PhoE